jgi:hypothetical protein
VKAKAFGPLWIVALIGFTLSCILLALSIWQRDGFSFIAVIALSAVSSIVGIGNKWTLNLPKRKNQNLVTPPGNVVIRYPKGSFLVIQCHEDVARELYFAPESIDYLIAQSWKYRMISLVGTFLLMVGVIALSNASTYLQIGFAGSYMFLNASYWVVAALPAKVHWDMSCFEVIDQAFEEDEKSEFRTPSQGKVEAFVDYNDTFTRALFKVIVATKDIGWIKRSAAAPATKAWDDWLQYAKAHAETATSKFVESSRGKNIKTWQLPPKWDPQDELNKLIKFYDSDLETKVEV